MYRCYGKPGLKILSNTPASGVLVDMLTGT